MFHFSKREVAWKPTETVIADLNSVLTYLNECQKLQCKVPTKFLVSCPDT